MVDFEDIGKSVIYILIIIILLMIIFGMIIYGKPILEAIKERAGEKLIDVGEWLKP